MNEWGRYKAEDVLKNTDTNGNRLISAFAKDYRAVFNQDICPNCNGFREKFQKYLKKNQDMSDLKEKNSGFVLKKMYKNIPLEFGSAIYVNNQNLTDDYAKKLINSHSRGKDLFEIIPKNVNTDNSEGLPQEIIDLLENTKKELVQIAKDLGIEGDDLKGNKIQLSEVILRARKEEVEFEDRRTDDTAMDEELESNDTDIDDTTDEKI